MPKDLCNSIDIFQEKTNEPFNVLEYVRAYIDDLLIISNGNFEDHLNKVKIVLKKLKAAGFKINVQKSFFPDKVQATKHIAVPTNKKQLRSVIGGK